MYATIWNIVANHRTQIAKDLGPECVPFLRRIVETREKYDGIVICSFYYA
jgi:hypothetical protein